MVSDRYMSQDALMEIFHCSWIISGGHDLRVPSHFTFLFYFEEVDELDRVLQRGPWNINNDLLVVRKVEPFMNPSHLRFDVSRL